MDPTATHARRHWFLPVLVLLATAAVYLPGLDGPFVFDDQMAVVGNPMIRRILPLSRFFDASDRQRIVVVLSLALNHAVGDMDPRGYHLFNLAVHMAAGVVLYTLVRGTLLTAGGKDDAAGAGPAAAAGPTGHRSALVILRPASAGIAAAAMALWLLHPLQTESVQYVIQRAESLMALCYLLVLELVRRGSTAGRGHWAWYGGALLVCAAGMLSKQVMLTAPLAVLLYDRAFLAGSIGAALRRRPGLYAGLLLCAAIPWLMGLGSTLAGGAADSPSSVGLGLSTASPLQYLLAQATVVVHYLRLAVFPDRLVLDYYWPLARTLEVAAPRLVVMVVLAVVSLWALVRLPRAGFLPAAFFITLGPSSSFIPVLDLAAEHRMYLPLAPLAVMAAVGGAWVFRSRRRWGVGLALMISVLLAGRTAVRVADYRTAPRIWADVVDYNPRNPRALMNLGAAEYDAGRPALAISHLRRALRLVPRYDAALRNLGAIHFNRNDYDAARYYFKALARFHPGSVDGPYYLGEMAFREQNVEAAAARLTRVLDLQPRHARALERMGRIHAHRGQLDAAAGMILRSLESDPALMAACDSMGIVAGRMVSQGDRAEAQAWLRRALAAASVGGGGDAVADCLRRRLDALAAPPP